MTLPKLSPCPIRDDDRTTVWALLSLFRAVRFGSCITCAQKLAEALRCQDTLRVVVRIFALKQARHRGPFKGGEAEPAQEN